MGISLRTKDILEMIQERMSYCVHKLEDTLLNHDYEELVLTPDNTPPIISICDKENAHAFNFFSYRVMRKIVGECELLLKRDYELVNVEEYFNFEEQIQISKALMMGIIGNNFAHTAEYALSIWDWVNRLGDPNYETPKFDWDKFMTQEKEESYV